MLPECIGQGRMAPKAPCHLAALAVGTACTRVCGLSACCGPTMPSASSVSSASQLASLSPRVAAACRCGDSEVMEVSRRARLREHYATPQASPPGHKSDAAAKNCGAKWQGSSALTPRAQPVALGSP